MKKLNLPQKSLEADSRNGKKKGFKNFEFNKKEDSLKE